MTTAILREMCDCPIPLAHFTHEGRLRQSNAPWDVLFDGPDWLARVHPDDVDAAAKLSRHGTHDEFRVRRDDGWSWVAARSVVDEQGVRLWAMPIRSVEATDDSVRRALARERELNELKSRFISLVSHEFRTPLTVILSSAELIEHYGAGWDEARRSTHLRKIHASVAGMSALLDNVALYGRVEAGTIEVTHRQVDVAEICSEAMQEASALAPAGQRVELRDGAPATVVENDPRLLRNILVNLVSNALRYSPPGGEVELEIAEVPRGVEVRVLDRGLGIPLEDRERVWERFQRGSNVGSIPGTGLGLAIVRRCLELTGATLVLEDRPGGGTAASLVLPKEGGGA